MTTTHSHTGENRVDTSRSHGVICIDVLLLLNFI